MAGDPSKAALWANADVYIAPKGTAAPANAGSPWGAAWKPVGLLDGDAGFSFTREEETADHYAWGGILVRTSRRNFKQSVTFTALEDNDETRSLVWPGSSSSVLKVPRPERILMGFERREGTRVHRLISAYEAEVTADTFDSNEVDLTSYPLTATIFPNTAEEIFLLQDSGVLVVTSLDVTGDDTPSVGEIVKLTATANLSPSGTADVSHLASWSSSDPAVATVAPGGYMTGIGAGTANVTATYQGRIDSLAVTVA